MFFCPERPEDSFVCNKNMTITLIFVPVNHSNGLVRKHSLSPVGSKGRVCGQYLVYFDPCCLTRGGLRFLHYVGNEDPSHIFWYLIILLFLTLLYCLEIVMISFEPFPSDFALRERWINFDGVMMIMIMLTLMVNNENNRWRYKFPLREYFFSVLLFSNGPSLSGHLGRSRRCPLNTGFALPNLSMASKTNWHPPFLPSEIFTIPPFSFLRPTQKNPLPPLFIYKVYTISFPFSHITRSKL